MARVQRCPLLCVEKRFLWNGRCWQASLVLAALCTVGKNSLINALAQVRESQGQQSRESFHQILLKPFYRA